MSFEIYFKEFCDKYGYSGKFCFDKQSKEYQIIISKGDDNGGLFMSKEELLSMDNDQIINWLQFLHNEFLNRFHK